MGEAGRWAGRRSRATEVAPTGQRSGPAATEPRGTGRL